MPLKILLLDQQKINSFNGLTKFLSWPYNIKKVITVSRSTLKQASQFGVFHLRKIVFFKVMSCQLSIN